jgi:glucokinase
MTKTIEVSDETFEKIKDQLIEASAVCDFNGLEDMVGKKFFFRTVTYHTVGRVTAIVGDFAVLTNCSWVADSGRFAAALKTGKFKEVEYMGTGIVNMKACVDFFPFYGPLPTETI